MKTLQFASTVIAGLFVCALNAPGDQGSNNVEERVNAILSKMTLSEKLSYIGGDPGPSGIGVFKIKAIPRLGLPQIEMGNGPLGIADQIHNQPSNRYPAGLALAASWSRDRARARGRQMGRDARARGFHVDLGPGVDLYRTALGGRNFEYQAGEDPYLGSQLVVPLIMAMQQQGVWANVKHYAANEQEYRRESIDIEVDERSLRELYLPPFEAAVVQGQSASVMGALNAVDGDFACESYFLDTQVLKKDWGFDGVLLSDYQGIHDGVKAAIAGCDLDMPFGTSMNESTLLPAIQGGQLSMSTIDDKVRRILRKIVAFGFLDRPQLDKSIPLDDLSSAFEALLEAREGIVLLKNKDNLLPLQRNKVHSIAVMGRLAQSAPPTGFGSSWIIPQITVSELLGIAAQAGPTVKVDFVNAGAPDPASSEWSFVQPGGAAQTGLKGEYYDSSDLSGSPVLTRIDKEVNYDWTLPGTIPSAISTGSQESFSVRWTGQIHPAFTGDQLFKVRADGGIRLYVNGQLVIDTFFAPPSPPVYGTTLSSFTKVYLQAGQSYNVELDYHRTTGFASGSGSLLGVQFSWTPLVVPPNLSTYDAVVMCQGIDNEYDGEGLDLAFRYEDQGVAGLERAIILPEYQNELILNALQANPKTIVVLNGPGNFDIQSWVDRVPGLLHAWYPGEVGGLGLGEILFGDVNPSAKLPISMEKRLPDNPSTASYPTRSDAFTINYTEGIFMGYRGFDTFGIKPQFSFGYGLSYTTFTYSDLSIRSLEENSSGGLVNVSFIIKNTGQRAGAEIAEIYIGQQHPKIARPLKELKGFEKVFLNPGQSKSVNVTLDRRAFAYFDVGSHQWHADRDSYHILVGSSLDNIQLTGKVVLKSALEFPVAH